MDTYRGEKAEHNLLDFALFVGFFPQMVSGPISRGNRLLPQLSAAKRPAFDDLRDGVLPVSYTHLDVYKRQAWKRWSSPTASSAPRTSMSASRWITCRWKNGNLYKKSEYPFSFGYSLFIVIAVSYTHLKIP